MRGSFGCNAAAEPVHSAFLGTPQASPSCLEEEKKKERAHSRGKIDPLKLPVLNVSMSFVIF